MSVSGFTTVRMRRHSISHDSATSAIRVGSSARRGFTCRSTYNASCFLRNRFSAASCACDRPAAETSRVSPLADLAARLHAQDRAWFYQALRVDEVKGEAVL